MSCSARIQLIALAVVIAGGSALPAQAAPQGAAKKKARTAAPDRIVITAEDSPTPTPPAPEPTPLGPARPMTAADSSGTMRAPGEPRLITGSLIPQKFDLYANDASTAIPLQVFTASDLAARGKTGKGGPVAPNYTDSVSPGAAPRGTPEPTFVRVRTTHTLDLRTVPPAERLETAVRLLGEERGRKLVSDFNRWEAARKKRQLAVHWNGDVS